MTDSEFVVVVTKPGYDTVRLGTALKHTAEIWASRLEIAMIGTQHPEGTTITAGPYVGGPYINVDTIPSDPVSLAPMIAEEKPSNGTGHNFPDLYTILSMLHGHDRAGDMWSTACSIQDESAEFDRIYNELPAAIQNALTQVHAVRTLYRQLEGLTGESMTGSDPDFELAAAARALRNVARYQSEQEATFDDPASPAG